jgi:hypothetical protein
METIWTSETSVDTQRTTRRYIPDDGTLLVTTVIHNIVNIFVNAVQKSSDCVEFQDAK